jgi:hypothetical protein
MEGVADADADEEVQYSVKKDGRVLVELAEHAEVT